MNLFEVRQVHFSYKDKEIFTNLTFNLDKGELILGHNGVGKSTLIQCCVGI